MSKPRQSSLFGALCLMAQPIILNILSIPATAYIIRGLGASGYGQWMVGTSLVAATMFLANLGLRTLFIRAIAQEPGRAGEALATQLGLRSLLALMAGGLALLLCVCLHYPPVVLQCVALAAGGLLLSTVATTLSDVLQGTQHLAPLATINLVSGLSLTLFSVLAIWRGVGPVGLSVSYLTGPLVSVALLSAFVHRRLFPISVRWNFEQYRKLLRDVRAMGMQQFLATIQDRVQQLLVPKLLGLAAFGYFSAGLIPASRLEVVPDGLMMYYYSAISHSYQQDRKAAAQQVTQFLIMSLISCVPLALLVSFLAHPIAQMLFPRHSAVCQEVIRITIWSLPIASLSRPLLAALQAAGRHSEAARAQTGTIILNCLLSFFLISRFGVTGACWSWVLGYVFSAACLVPLFIRTFPAVLFRIPFARIALCAAAMALLLGLSTLLRLNPVSMIAEATVAGLSAYIGSLLLLRVVNASDISRIFSRRLQEAAD